MMLRQSLYFSRLLPNCPQRALSRVDIPIPRLRRLSIFVRIGAKYLTFYITISKDRHARVYGGKPVVAARSFPLTIFYFITSLSRKLSNGTKRDC